MLNIPIIVFDPDRLFAVSGQKAFREHDCPCTTIGTALDLGPHLARYTKVNILLYVVRALQEDDISRIQGIHQTFSNTAVIVLAQHYTDESLLQCIKAGASRYFPLQHNVESLRTIINQVIDEKTLKPNPEKAGLSMDSGIHQWVELTAPSKQEYLKRLQDLFNIIYGSALSDDEKEEMQLVIGEICGNAMEWGNKHDASRIVRVSYCLFPGEIVIKIEDEGEGFDPDVVEDPSKDPLAHFMKRGREGKRIGGYGLFIIRKIMDQVIYNEKGNAVILSKKLMQPS